MDIVSANAHGVFSDSLSHSLSLSLSLTLSLSLSLSLSRPSRVFTSLTTVTAD